MNDKIEEIHILFKEIGPLNYKLMYPKLEKVGFYPGQPIIIEIIYKNPGISQIKLAKLTHKEPATITTMLGRMSNLIKKLPDNKDKRIYNLYLTEKGIDSYNDLKEIMEENRNILFNDFTEKEIEDINKILKKIKNNIEKKLI